MLLLLLAWFAAVLNVHAQLGVPLWTNRYHGPPDVGYFAYAAAVGDGSNVIVAGISDGGGPNPDYLTIAYSSAGAPMWTNFYNGPAYGGDYATALAVDRSGNAFVAGYSYGAGSYCDYATVAYSSSGLPLWTNRYNGPGNNDDVAEAIVVDSNSKVFVTGYSWSGDQAAGGSAYDYATVAYSGAGIALWTNRYSGPQNGYDYPSAIAVDSIGTVFVTGYSASTNGFLYDYDYATVAYSVAGVPLWTNRHGGLAHGDEFVGRALRPGGDHAAVVMPQRTKLFPLAGIAQRGRAVSGMPRTGRHRSSTMVARRHARARHFRPEQS